MILRPYLHGPTACASHLLGCGTRGRLAVVDPHEALVEADLAEAERLGSPIVAVFETHVQADHVSGRRDARAPVGDPDDGAAVDHVGTHLDGRSPV